MLDPQGRGMFFHKWMVEVPTVRGVHRKRYVFGFVGRASMPHDLVSASRKVIRAFAVQDGAPIVQLLDGRRVRHAAGDCADRGPLKDVGNLRQPP